MGKNAKFLSFAFNPRKLVYTCVFDVQIYCVLLGLTWKSHQTVKQSTIWQSVVYEHIMIVNDAPRVINYGPGLTHTIWRASLEVAFMIVKCL